MIKLIPTRHSSIFFEKALFSPQLQTARRFSSTIISNNKLNQINLTFFSKENCGLCEEAKDALINKILKSKKITNSKNSIDLKFIDIEKVGNENWFDCYRYDIPVLHVDRENYKTVKFMHRLNYDDVVDELSEDL